MVDALRMESWNPKNGIAKEIKNNAKGYKNFLRYRNRCLYCMNKTTKPNYAGSQNQFV